MLRAHEWKVKYTPEDGDLVDVFYVPALRDAKRYDRLTGYFTASAFEFAAQGIDELVRSGGRMRMVVGNALDEPEIRAIQEGLEFRDAVTSHLLRSPLEAAEQDAVDALELIAWMVAAGHLDVKIAVPVEGGVPVKGPGIFHEKSGVIEDAAGDRIAWTGSLNETAQAWRLNWETINVSTSWEDLRRVACEEESFDRIWHGRTKRWRVLDLPSAVRERLLVHCPANGKLPRRLRIVDHDRDRRRVWSFIHGAASKSPGGDQVGRSTAPIAPWPHQMRAFERLYDSWPPKLLIADEVGLGKTIQAGLLLRQAQLSGRAERILVGVPAAVRDQWQIELYEKFNLNWPIYTQGKLRWHATESRTEPETRPVRRDRWHEEPVVIVSSQLMRTRKVQTQLLERAEPWDLVVLDEAHHARRRGAGGGTKGKPNLLLRLMRRLKDRTQGLLLLTATPMQVHPIELWDLLDLLGLPSEWSPDAFLEFFEHAQAEHVPAPAFETMARLFQAAEAELGPQARDSDPALAGLSPLSARNVLKDLRDPHDVPRLQLSAEKRTAALRLLKAHTPVRHLVSRHTRSTLRRYCEQGLLDARIAERNVRDQFLEMTDGERELYQAVERYIVQTYDRATGRDRNPVGFVMTLYRRRLASSVHALITTLERRLNQKQGRATRREGTWHEDRSDDELSEVALKMDRSDIDAAEKKALAAEDVSEIRTLLAMARALPVDSKFAKLEELLVDLGGTSGEGRQTMVFTQYTDTIDFLRRELWTRGRRRLMCFTGRGGEVPSSDGRWEAVGRDEVKRRFRGGEADVLLCTEAAAEGLNFQFCKALVNYDMPWNPMRVEQRIGRIDRLGQAHDEIDVDNLYYKDTIEADIYDVLGGRHGSFQGIVGPLPPILAKVSGKIAGAVLQGRASDAEGRRAIARSVEREMEESPTAALDIEEAVATEVRAPELAPSPVTMDDLDRVLNAPHLMPDGLKTVRRLSQTKREYELLDEESGQRVRVTTDPEHFEAHSDSVGLWSPGHPLFPIGAPQRDAGDVEDAEPEATTLSELLDRVL